MKFAKRMVVITEDEYKKLKAKKAPTMYDKALTYKQNMGKKLHKSHRNPLKIDGYFTPDHQTRVKTLMQELLSYGMKIKSNREIQLPHGDTVDGSDIIALMKELFVGSRMSAAHPTGWREFTEIVARSGAPTHMISKTPARNLIQRLREETMSWEAY